MFRAGVVAPLLYEWDMEHPVLHKEYFRGATNSKKSAGIGALKQIHPQILRVAIGEYYQGLVMIITPKHELKELSIRFCDSYRAAIGLFSALMKTTDAPLSTETPDGHVATPSNFSGTVTKVICPNLKALDLRFRNLPHDNREKVRYRCVQMMEGRKQAGNPLRRCNIRWDEKCRKDSVLVLITSNEGMIENK